MNKAEIYIPQLKHKGTYTAPSKFDEFTATHLMKWAGSMASSLPVNQALMVLAVLLYDMPAKFMRYIPRTEAKRLGRSVRFVLGKNMLYRWLFPFIKLNWRKYHGPKSGLTNITVQEFTATEACYERYQQGGNVEYLDTLAAILYRPRRWFNINSDIRIPLTVHGYTKRAKAFAKLPRALKVAIYLNYEGCRNFLHTKHPSVFMKGKAGTKLELTPWNDIVLGSSGDIFGTVEHTRDANLHDFLTRLGAKMRDAKEFEDKYGKGK